MDKFKGKYRIASNRLKGWDYSSEAMYFITLVTQNRECNLGYIENEKMILSDFGKIMESEWLKSFDIRNELFLDEYIIMPNHLHAIVVIDKTDDVETHGVETHGVETHGVETHGVETHGVETHGVETHGRASLQSPSQSPLHRLPKSISSFIGGFKSAINSKIDDYIDEHHLTIPKYNRKNHFFQPNYHDHIIRNQESYMRIKNYIVTNPQKWADDILNKP
jgi:REP element-mobilizing transposase RayT